MKRLVLVFVLCATPSWAQTPEPLAWTGGHQDIADWLSTAGVVGQGVAASVEAWHKQDRLKAFGRLGCQYGIAAGVSELLKATIRETRPDGTDRRSFPSEHTATTTAMGWSFAFQVPIAAFVGISRAAANRHHLWPDVAAGWAIGAGAQALCTSLIKVRE